MRKGLLEGEQRFDLEGEDAVGAVVERFGTVATMQDQVRAGLALRKV